MSEAGLSILTIRTFGWVVRLSPPARRCANITEKYSKMSKTITIPSDPNTETLISAIDMIIEAQDNGYSILVTNDNETQGVLYKDAKNFKVMVNVLGIEFDMVALRRKALKKEYEAIGESYMLTVGKIPHTIKVCSHDDIDRLINGICLKNGHSYEELLKMMTEDVKQQIENE